MLAVIEIGGKQYNVMLGTKFQTEKLEVEEGKTFDIEKVLLVSDDEGKDFKLGMPLLKEEKVKAKVLTHGKKEKIRVFKMKSKKRYAKTQGHRQQYTEIEIVEIAGAKKAASASTAKPKVAVKTTKNIKAKETAVTQKSTKSTTVKKTAKVAEKKTAKG